MFKIVMMRMVEICDGDDNNDDGYEESKDNENKSDHAILIPVVLHWCLISFSFVPSFPW